MKTELVVRPGIIAIKVDEKSFFSTILGFFPHGLHKQYKQYISQKIVNLCKIDKIHLKCDVNDGSILNAIQSPTLFIFILDKSMVLRCFANLKRYTTKI